MQAAMIQQNFATDVNTSTYTCTPFSNVHVHVHVRLRLSCKMVGYIYMGNTHVHSDYTSQIVTTHSINCSIHSHRGKKCTAHSLLEGNLLQPCTLAFFTSSFWLFTVYSEFQVGRPRLHQWTCIQIHRRPGFSALWLINLNQTIQITKICNSDWLI